MAPPNTIQRQAYPVKKPDYQPPLMATVQQQPDFMGLLNLINQNQQSLLKQSQTPVSRISKDQFTQRGTPGLDQWHANNPTAPAAGTYEPSGNYGAVGPDIPAGPNPAMQPQVPDGQPQSHELAPAPPSLFNQFFDWAHNKLTPTGVPGAAAAPPVAGAPGASGQAPQAQTGNQNPGNLSYTPMNPDPTQPASTQTAQAPQSPQAAPIADVSSTPEGFSEPQQVPGAGLAGLIQGGGGINSFLQPVGQGLNAAAGGINNYVSGLGQVAANAGGKIPALQGAYDSALGAVGAGQKALSSGLITAGELTPAVKAVAPAYNALKTGVNVAQGAENVAARAGSLLSPIASGGSRVAGALGVAGKIAAPVQAGLMLAEAYRLASDPEYRARADQRMDSLSQDGSLAGLGQSLTSPISTIYGLGKNVADIATREGAGVGNQRVQDMQSNVNQTRAKTQSMREAGATPQDIQKYMAQFRKTKQSR